MNFLSKCKKYPSWSGVVLMVLVWLVFFFRIVSGRYIYFLDDLKILYFPLEVAYSSFQKTWHLPLWSPLFGFGQPLLAWGQLGFFTPIHVLLRALSVSPVNVLQISVLAYFALGLAGFYYVLRQHRIHEWAAATGAIVYTFSGFNIGHLNHVNFYVGTMVLPWLLVSVHYFLRRPSLVRTALMALTAAIIALSAQPQVALYCFVIATLYGVGLASSLIRRTSHIYKTKVIFYTLGAAVIAFCLSSLAILPVAEFLPETERNADLPVEELLDFSYQPSHAITLISPYFFGNHTSYWGAKGFQELAAFTGVLPLFFAALALSRWQTMRHVRATGLVLVLIGIIMALGRYSPLYSYFVVHHIITTLNIPGRFVFFFITGIALLCAVGLQDISTVYHRRFYRIIKFALPFIVLITILTPFAVTLKNPIVANRLWELCTSLDSSLLLAILGVVVYYLTVILSPRISRKSLVMIIPSITIASTLLIFGYNYSPVNLRENVTKSLVFTEPLSVFSHATGLPARLYSREVLLNSIPRHKVVATEPLSPHYTIFQPIVLTIPSNPCFIIPMQAATPEGEIEVSLLSSINGPVLDSQKITALKTMSSTEQGVCFSTTVTAHPAKAVLGFSSETETTIRLGIYPIQNPSAYLVRTKDITTEVIAASQKPFRIDVTEDVSGTYDTETFLLARHLQVVGNSSSARWIGALSIRPYREFIEYFLANDLDNPFTGDGQHIIEDNRLIFNMLGVTHFAQYLPYDATDKMTEANFTGIKTAVTGAAKYMLYENPQAFPKAWLVPRAVFVPSADETRNLIHQSDFNPKQKVYISGPTPPSPQELGPEFVIPQESEGSVTITTYEPTRVILKVNSPSDSWLIMSDATTPQWHTFIDDVPAPYYVAHTFMKATFVPAGEHTVTFSYSSPAINLALKMTLAGLLILFATFATALVNHFYYRIPVSRHRLRKK